MLYVKTSFYVCFIMEDKQLRGILNKYKSYKNQAREVLDKAWSIDKEITELHKDYYSGEIPKYYYEDCVKYLPKRLQDVTKSLIESFNNSITKDENFLEDLKVNPINTKGIISRLNEMITECDVIIGTLEGDISGLSSKQLDKLGHLKNEISVVCKNLNTNFEKNLIKSVELSEGGKFLGSALITSRVIDYTINQINGNNINEKIKTLIESGALEKDDDKTKEQIIKVSKKSRNYLNHRIDTFAEPSEALSLLGDCVTLLKIFEMTQK